MVYQASGPPPARALPPAFPDEELGAVAPVALGVVAPGGHVLAANPALAAIFGCPTVADLLATPLTCFHALPALALEVLSERLVGSEIRGAELELLRTDGSSFPARVHARILPEGKDGPKAAFSVEDITDLRDDEAESSQDQKMEAVVRFAAGLAHDYNNLLTTILGEARDIARRAEEGSDEADSAEAILDAARRAAEITRHLLVFSRSEVARAEVVDLNEATRALHPVIRALLPADVEFVLRLEEPGQLARIDPRHLESILTHLLTNARDALPGGGRVVIESGVVNAPEDTDGLELQPPVPPGTYAYLAVGDSGIGMNQETRRRIFDPFFTTKERGRGAGLGLATVYGLVRRAHGYISVLSAPAYGTVVRVLLPTTKQAALPMRPRVEGRLRLPTMARVLVVDDEASVRVVMTKVLGRAGYTVLEAEDAVAAKRIIRESEIDLLVTDVMMPRIKGTDLAKWAVERDPPLPVLLVSGYSDSELLEPWIDADPDVFLCKPFEPDELLERVRQRLTLQ
ncbi:MAG: response regulator [Longimicrobiales bacterium]